MVYIEEIQALEKRYKKIDDELKKIEKQLSQTHKHEKKVETIIQMITDQIREIDNEKRILHRMT